MTVKKDRNYWLAFILCVSCSVLALLGEGASIKFLILSDINVAIFLYVAWMFDDSKVND